MRKALRNLTNENKNVFDGVSAELPRRKSARLAAKIAPQKDISDRQPAQTLNFKRPKIDSSDKLSSEANSKTQTSLPKVTQPLARTTPEERSIQLANNFPREIHAMRLSLWSANPDLLQLIRDPQMTQYSQNQLDYLKIHYRIGDEIEEHMPAELLVEPEALAIFDYLRVLEYRYLYVFHASLPRLQAQMDPALLDKRYASAAASNTNQQQSGPPPGLLLSRDQCITLRMRYIVINWLVQVHDQFELLPETLFVAITLLDLYLMRRIQSLPKTKLQVMGMACLFTAAKFEEIYSPTSADISSKAEDNFSIAEILEFERCIIREVNFRLTFPVPITFERRYSRIMLASNFQHSLAKYFIELTVLELGLNSLAASLRAAVALVLAQLLTLSVRQLGVGASSCPADDHLLQPPSAHSLPPSRDLWIGLLARVWTVRIQFHSGYRLGEVLPPLLELGLLVARQNLDSPQRAIRDKYSSPKYQGLAAHPLLRCGLLEALADYLSVECGP